MLPEEAGRLHDAVGIVWETLPERHRDVIRAYGILESDGSGLRLRCVNDRACVFVAWDGDVAVCSIQRAFEEGRFDWPKPQSCHLFPIRLRGSRRHRLVFEEFSGCREAEAFGTDRSVRLVDFLESALTRVFGRAFFEELRRLPAGSPDAGASTAGASTAGASTAGASTAGMAGQERR